MRCFGDAAQRRVNWWKTDNGIRHTATSDNMPAGLPYVTQLDLGSTSRNTNPNLILIATQRWKGVYNDRAIGVWFNTATLYLRGLAPFQISAGNYGTKLDVRRGARRRIG